MEKLLKLTDYKGRIILIGVESIISVTPYEYTANNPGKTTEITSRQAMAISHFVQETVEEIYEQYKN